MDSDHGHFIEKCRICGDTIAQCRCPSLNKTLRLGVCVKCERERSATPLVTYLTTFDGRQRDASFLRLYAGKVRDGTALTWEIPSVVAATLEGIAIRLEQAVEPAKEQHGRHTDHLHG